MQDREHAQATLMADINSEDFKGRYTVIGLNGEKGKSINFNGLYFAGGRFLEEVDEDPQPTRVLVFYRQENEGMVNIGEITNTVEDRAFEEKIIFDDFGKTMVSFTGVAEDGDSRGRVQVDKQIGHTAPVSEVQEALKQAKFTFN